jgi:hypothetical protein
MSGLCSESRLDVPEFPEYDLDRFRNLGRENALLNTPPQFEDGEKPEGMKALRTGERGE